jgi:hypothetical protein
VQLSNVAAQPGDEIVLEQPPGTIAGEATYDDLPTFDAEVCAGATSVTAAVGDAGSVFGSAYNGYASGTPAPAATTLAGGRATIAFGGPVAAGYFVEIGETRRLGGLDVTSERTVSTRDCSAPPLPGPPPPPGPVTLPPEPAKQAPAGFIQPVRSPRARSVLRHGLALSLMTSEPVRIAVSLVHGPTTVAKGTSSAIAPGSTGVLLRPTAAGRRLLRRGRAVHARLVGTLVDADGQRTALQALVVTLRP